jgi:hypothetical protein
MPQQLTDKIKQLQAEADKLSKIKELFTDLEEHRDRWSKTYLVAKSANSKVDKFDTKHSCGCCNDSPYYAMFYLEVEGTKVYADPFQICIGEKSMSYYGENWDSDWKERILKHGIPEAAAELIRPLYEKDEKRRLAYENYQEEIEDL